MRAKIIETAFWSIPLIYLILSVINYYKAYLVMDDDTMCIIALNLAVVTCTIIIGVLLTSFIDNVWRKDKTNKKTKK